MTLELPAQTIYMIHKRLLVNRIAVSSLFFINGFLYANWTARLPELQQYFNLNNGQLGTVLFCIALGSLVAMPAAGWLGNRYGSDRIVVIMALLFCVTIPLVAVSQREWIIRLCFFGLGAASGSMDVTMNGQAVLVERLWGKIIFSSFHAIFSIGMALGAVSGGVFASYGISFSTHLLSVAALGLLVILWASSNLIRDRAAPVEESVTGVETGTFDALKAILPFGIIAFCCMMGEGSMVDWSALFMHTVVGQSEEISAWAFGVFALAMTIGRTFGDYVTAKLGLQRVMLLNALLATAGLGLAVTLVTVWSTFLGFFLVGLGLSTIVPLVFSQAGNTKGITPSVGISAATTIGYTGFFVGPPVIGYLSEAFNLRVGLSFVLSLFMLMAVIILYLSRRRAAHQSL